MDDRKGSSTVGGVGFVGMLTIAFIVLKLCKVINWSWWWVTAPFWIPIGIVALCVIIAAIILALAKDE